MTGFNIQIADYADKDKVVWDDLKPETTTEGQITNVGILERGMQSGQASLTFRIQLPDGNVVLAQTSANLLKGLLAALTGAEARWAEQNAKSN